MSSPFETIESAVQRLTEAVETVTPVRMRLRESVGHILRSPVRAESDQPAYDRSAMDGYAVHGESSEGAWTIVREIPAGSPAGDALAAGTAVRILTGSPVPQGAARVLPVEIVEKAGETITCREFPETDHIRRRGDDCRAGDLLLEPGGRIGPLELALLAQQGMTEPEVSPYPSVLHLTMGDELVPAERKPTGSQIRDTNTPLIRGLLQEAGWPPDRIRSRWAGDTMGAVRTALAGIDEIDLLLISGGAWKSDKDLAAPILKELGFEWLVRGVDLRPGKPFSAAKREGRLALVFPGNPVSHWVTWHVLAKPAVHKLLGATTRAGIVEAALTADWNPGPDGRELRWPGRLEFGSGRPTVTPLPLASSGDLSSLAGANALIHHRPDGSRFATGDSVCIEKASGLV